MIVEGYSTYSYDLLKYPLLHSLFCLNLIIEVFDYNLCNAVDVVVGWLLLWHCCGLRLCIRHVAPLRSMRKIATRANN